MDSFGVARKRISQDATSNLDLFQASVCSKLRYVSLDEQSAPLLKIRMCNRYSNGEGCMFGDKCHFAHRERDLGKAIPLAHDDRLFGPIGRLEPPPPGRAAAVSFGASATTKIIMDASLADAIIGKGGVNSKPIYTRAKLSIREHETNVNLMNIELEGTFNQIKQIKACFYVIA